MAMDRSCHQEGKRDSGSKTALQCKRKCMATHYRERYELPAWATVEAPSQSWPGTDSCGGLVYWCPVCGQRA